LQDVEPDTAEHETKGYEQEDVGDDFIVAVNKFYH
jgi:hypothetical protein